MIAYIGYISLLSALVLSAAAFGTFFIRKINQHEFVKLSVTFVFVFMTMSFGCLTYSYIVSDFSLLNVYENSHVLKPLLYKITGVWGNHEGSILMFLWLFAALNFLYQLRSDYSDKTRILTIQLGMFAGICAYIFFTSNPFERIFPVPENGLGLNPLLQDIGLAIHPPLLYIGYVGFSLSLSYGISALLTGDADKKWAYSLTPWVLVAWSFLTLGIFIGSWWAYRELGWGGFWFWDPVENSSLLPWLSGAALLHSIIVTRTREALKGWTIFLAMLTFSLSLIGFFLVRSGILMSVHSFASDPTRGIFMLVIFAIICGGAYSVFARKIWDVKAGRSIKLLSREGMILINNLFIMVACFTVLLGTLYPVFLDLLMGKRISVGAPYFNIIFNPIALSIIFLAAIGSIVKWKKDEFLSVILRLKFSFLISLVVFAALIMREGELSIFPLSLAFAAYLASSMLMEFLRKLDYLADIKKIKSIPISFYSMFLAHLGVAILVASISALSHFGAEKEFLMGFGDKATIGEYEIKFDNASFVKGANYVANRGRFRVYKNAEEIAVLNPESRIYIVSQMKTIEADIYSDFKVDVYVVIGEEESNKKYAVRIYVKPYMSWVWIGSFMIALGAFIGAFSRRRKDKS